MSRRSDVDLKSIPIRSEGAVVSRIDIGPGLVRAMDVGRLLLPGSRRPQKVAVFAQPGSVGIASELAGSVGGRIRELPDREEAKRLPVVEESFLWLNELGFTRGDLVVGVGGGALTDVVGFVAATYLRGVPVALVPTTLLAAVDAAIGGKTGVNVGGKNLAGTFRHPGKVVIDTEVIAALPTELIREGGAEAVKAGWLADPALVDLYERHGIEAPVAEVVWRSAVVKAEIVSADFTEQDRRAWLNYGHTVGHAVEVLAGISHGHAVAVGMVAAAAVSERRLSFPSSDRLRRILEKMGLPTAAPGLKATAVRDLMALDKKRDERGLRMTLLRSVAEPVVVHVDDADVEFGLEAVGIR